MGELTVPNRTLSEAEDRLVEAMKAYWTAYKAAGLNPTNALQSVVDDFVRREADWYNEN